MRIKDGFYGERSIVLPKVVLDMVQADPLTSQLHITDIGYYPRALHHYRERKEPVSQYILIYCIDGKGWCEVDGQKFTITTNQYFIIPPHKAHCYAADKANPWTIYWIHFAGPLAQCYVCDDALRPQSIDPGRQSRIGLRINLFEEIYNAINDSFALDNLRYAFSVLAHYLASLQYIKLYRNFAHKSQSEESGVDVVEGVIHYLNENIERHLTLEDIAQYAGISASHFHTVFKQRTGHSPLNYFNLLKVKEACNLLDNTAMKLNQISFKIGIQDPYYFSRMFSKTMGMSPKAYRNRKKT